AIDEAESADHPAVLGVREAESPQPREHVLTELRALPRRLARGPADHLARGTHRPAVAVRQLDDPEERIDERVLDLELVERPALSAVRRAGDVALDAGRHAVLRVRHVDAVERRQVEDVEDARALHQSLLLLVPRLAAVGGAQDLPELADHPAV